MITKTETGTYCITDANGANVYITEEVAQSVYETIKKEKNRKDFIEALTKFCKDDEYDINKLSSNFIDKLVDTYEDRRRDDEKVHYLQLRWFIIGENIKDILNELDEND